MRMKDEDWDKVIDVNLTAVARLSRGVLRGMMKAKEGRIINITSVVGSIGNAGQMNYAASKAGVESMSRALAREVGSRNITVNCIAPGFIDTDMTKSLPEDVVTGMLKQIPLARFGNPEDVARRSRLSGFTKSSLYYRHRCACEWRHVHELNEKGPFISRFF